MGALSGRVVVFVMVQPSYAIILCLLNIEWWRFWGSERDGPLVILWSIPKSTLLPKIKLLSNSLRVYKHYNPVLYNVTFDSYYFPWINIHYTYIAWETPNALVVARLILQMVWDQGCIVCCGLPLSFLVKRLLWLGSEHAGLPRGSLQGRYCERLSSRG